MVPMPAMQRMPTTHRQAGLRTANVSVHVDPGGYFDSQFGGWVSSNIRGYRVAGLPLVATVKRCATLPSGRRTEGAGDKLHVDAAREQQRHQGFDLAIADQGVAANN